MDFGGFSTILMDFCGCLWIFVDFHHSRKSTGFLQESLLLSNKWVALQYTIWLINIAMEKP
jgi:hypothetical protein